MFQVWDPFVRIFHWRLVAIVASNRFYNETGGDWHEWLGYAACALIVLRLIWMRISKGYANGNEMWKTWPEPGEFLSHMKAYFRGLAPRVINHSPVALIGMIAMLFLILVLGLSGWLMTWDRFFGEKWLETLHHWTSNILLALVALHVAGVLRESFLHRENLVASMIHGKKRRE